MTRFRASCILAACLVISQPSLAQTETAQDLSQRITQMQARLDAAQQQLEEYHTVLDELRQQLKVLQAAPAASSNSSENAAEISRLQQAVSDLREQQTIQQAEIAVHEQSKVETRSKYSLRVGGLALFNAFSNDGAVDSVDIPTLALPRTADVAHGSLGATVRQTLLNLDATGPDLWGAHSYASLQADFYGGLSAANYTATGGLLRLRTADMLLEWPEAAVRAGLSPIILTPSTPTSYASVAQPALSWSGLLWAWTPQLSVEHPFSLGSDRRLSVTAAAADIPDAGTSYNSVARPATAAERSRYPGVETRAAFSWRADSASRVGASGYWSPHSYGDYGSFDAWAALVDWRLALRRPLELSGQVYKGEGLGGLGAGTYKDYVILLSKAANSSQTATYKGLRDQGGWAQLKFHPRSWIEFNEVFGMDNSSASQLRSSFVDPTSAYAQLTRNQTVLSNVIFRPRTALILSAEFRKLRSTPITGAVNNALIYSLSAGFEF